MLIRVFTLCQTSGLETGRSHFKNLRQLLEQYLTEKQNGYLQSGRLRGAIRELTLSDFNVLFATQNASTRGLVNLK